MAQKKFVKQQEVAVKDGKKFFKATVLTAYKDGRVKVKFEDGSDGVYPNKDVFDFETWSKKRDEKTNKDSSKEPAKDVEKDKIGDQFNIENLSETIDNDLDGILGGGSTDENADFSDIASDKKEDDSIFADTTKEDDDVFEQSPTNVDILEGKSLKELVQLVKEYEWHKVYSLNLSNTDTLEIIVEKIRANVPEEELGVKDEDSVFSDASPSESSSSSDDFDMDSEKGSGTGRKPLINSTEDDSLLKDEDVGDDWFTYGDHEDAKYKSLKRGTVRWWIPRGEKCNLTFISEKAFTYKEHRIRFEGQIYYISCAGGKGRRCLLCESKNRAYVGKAMYVIDHTEYYSKKHKKKMKNQVRLVVMKPPSYEPFRAVVSHYFEGADNITLRGVQITAQRSTGEKSPATGDIFFVNGVIKKDIFKGEFDKTLADLQKELKPMSQEDIASKIPMIEEEPAFTD